ncbi:MAG TPA: hypothetical protein VGP79_04160 [Bryobacteraceae bacterium]|jgi:hypothetical protein|nr:hypothetical protein [Bryobacteraceae bacterium]
MDHHVVAAFSIGGICLDVLGGLYLAYDLLGGQHGPLRLLTRMVTYSLVFAIGYGLGMGVFFGIACGVTTGITLAIELQRVASRHDHYALGWEALFSAIRGIGVGVAISPIAGAPYALAFAAMVTAGQVMAYSRGMRPGLDYSASGRPRFTVRQRWGALARTVGYTATALLCGALAGHLEHPWRFALRLGLVTGLVTASGITIIPFIEYYADNLPERRLGVFGIGLVLCGFALQSVQYWVAMLDIPIT